MTKYLQDSDEPKKSHAAKAGLQFPPSRARKLIEEACRSTRVGELTSVYLAAVLEYVAAEVLELSGNAARDAKRSRINGRSLALAIRGDAELDKLLPGTIRNGGVLPNIPSVLLPRRAD